VTHAFTLSAAQGLHFEHLGLQSDRTKLLTKGWELLSISTITSGSPFTVYSGIQQTGAGNDWRGPAGPDWDTGPIERRQFNPTARRYFGRGVNNASLFSIPIGIPGGPGQTPGALERSAVIRFEARAYYDFDLRSSRQLRLATGKAVWSERTCNSAGSSLICLISSTWGYPPISIEGTGFGMISKTAGTSRQVQFSLKLIY